MADAVVLDSEPSFFVVQIWAADESGPFVMDGYLRSRTGQPRQDKHHPQPRFHRRLRSRLGMQKNISEAAHPSVTRVGGRPRCQVTGWKPSGMKGRVGDDNGVDQTQPAAQLGDRANNGSRAHMPNRDDFIFGQTRAANRKAAPRGNASLAADGHLDRTAGLDVDPVQPRGREAGEREVGGKSAPGGFQPVDRVILQLAPHIHGGGNANPTRASHLGFIEADLPGLIDREWATKQLRWEHRLASHVTRIDHDRRGENVGC